MTNARKPSPPLQVLILLSILLPLVTACAHKESGPLYLHPGAASSGDYVGSRNSWIFDNGSIRVRVGEVTGGGEVLTPLTERLIAGGYVILRMEVRNLSGERVIFDPSRISFRYKTMGYKKPLDYTDLYEIGLKDSVVAGGLKGFGRGFYDLTETVPAGGRVSKLLVFRGGWDRAKKAVMMIKGVYMGEKELDLIFPFVLRPSGF